MYLKLLTKEMLIGELLYIRCRSKSSKTPSFLGSCFKNQSVELRIYIVTLQQSSSLI